jgi:hypothetical protein
LHGLDNRPFGVDQITWITKAAAVCCSKAVFRLPHRALPHSQIRESSAQQNHNRFTRLNNFLDWLLENELRDRNKTGQRFVASMSHELRTPLNAIIGLTEMMVSDAARFGTEKALEPLQRVNRAETHLLGHGLRCDGGERAGQGLGVHGAPTERHTILTSRADELFRVRDQAPNGGEQRLKQTGHQDEVLTLDISELLQSELKSVVRRSWPSGQRQKTDAGEFPRLLRSRRQRPRRSRTAEKRDELATRDHSITSSAIASSRSGTVSPSVLATLRLITNSNFVDCITGNSAGFSPLMMRPA